MGGKASRAKGIRRELEFLKLLGEELGIALERNYGQTNQGGADCIMVDGWAIEVKGVEQAQFPTWWNQAERQAASCNRNPALAWKRSRQPWRVWVSGDKSQVLTIAQLADLMRPDTQSKG